MSDSATTPVSLSSGVYEPGHLGELTQVVPPEMVDAALEATGGTQQRLRRLPSRVVVYLLLAGGLFAGQGWRQVWSRLTTGLTSPVVRPSGSALTAAMRRVGPGPVRELFALLAGPAATRAEQAVRFAGRLVVAIDGTQIAVPDTDANRARFPKSAGGPNGEPGYPMIRLLALVATGTRSMIDVAFGTDRVGELTYAAQLTRALTRGMLLLGDRNFAAYAFFTQITDTGADFLIRAKTGHGAMKLPVRRRLSDGSYLADAHGARVRVIDAEVTITTEADTRTGTYRLVTTLLDPDHAPARQLVELYHHRWQIETAYCELKSTILGGRVLRARHPSGVEQEVWALLAAYQVLRTAMSDATLCQPDVAPDRASFTVALQAARDQIIQAAGTIAGTAIDLVGRIGAAILADLLPARRIRTRPRVIKRAISKYRAKGRDVDHHTYIATLHTTILTPEPDD
ncbi:IS4 family transposase [Leekyejoonella antrihumi]|uniref:IS4 family transposase n=1 Tax=Leekyejoonella antrihumi TaxID=1660198 RepID=A0A563E668_9MICO|nr:IS4 family transposase [Leekyejoonella antrihumi]TWP38016.1 IS4 family transposase [Leekyejoonella antrihumi]